MIKDIFNILFTVLLGVSIFVLDLSIELGVAGGLPYIVFVLMGMRFRNKRVTILLGLIAILLTVVGFYLSQKGQQEIWKALLNRVYAVTAIIIVSGFVYSQKKILKERVKKSEDNFDKLSNLTFEGVLVHNQCIVVDINRSFEKMFGYSREELLGKNIIELLIPKKHHALINKSITKNYTKPFDIEGIRKDGSIFPMEIEGRGLVSENNETLRVAALRDVTERIKATEALKKSEKKFREIFEKSSDAILIIKNGLFVDCNQATIEMLNYKLKETFLNSHPSKLSPEFQPDGLKSNEKAEKMMTFALNKGTHRFEWMHKKRDGEIFPVEVLLTTISNEPKKKIIHCVWRDITDLKRADSHIKQLDIAIDNSVNEVYVFDSKTFNFSYANKGAIDNLGYTFDELNAMTPLNIKPEHTLESFSKLVYPLSSGEVNKLQFRTIHERKDKTTYPAEVNLSNFMLNNEMYYLALIIDITDRKKAEEENKKLSTAVEQSANTIIITDTEGKIEYVNPKFTEVTGYTTAEVLGKTPGLIKSGKHTKEFYSHLWKTIKDGNIWKGQFRTKAKNGTLYWEQATITPIKNDEGKITNYLAIKEDITFQKESEKVLKNALVKAKEADKLKSSFLANMSHEIRTPMNGIIGFSEFLLEPNLSENGRKEYANVVIECSKQLLNIVNDILDISKIEAGAIQLNYEKVSINKLIDDLYAFYQPKAKEKNLILHFEKGLGYNKSVVDIDKTKLNQVLKNLLSNAFKFTDEGSIEFGYELIEDKLQFYVKDTGVGIEEKFQNEIFDRFIRAESDLDKLYGGTGLGLSISKNFVELFKGEIWFTSSEQGTTMYFTIPYLKKETKITSVIIEDQQVGFNVKNKELTILIAEDEAYNRMYLNEVLSKTNFKIIEAHNGKQAVELFETHSEIDLVIMDIKMPKMNGVEAMKEIKKIKPSIPIIANSAFAMESDRQKALEQGFDSYLSKPIDRKLLFSIIGKYSK